MLRWYGHVALLPADLPMIDLEVIHHGPDDPVATAVLVHGAWHGAWCWTDGFAQRLGEAGVATASVSLRGHGGSGGHRRLNRFRLRHYADDVLSVVATLPGRPFRVGHSRGGGVVQHVLARRDRPVLAGAVLMASMPPSGVTGITLAIARREPGLFLRANATVDLGLLVDSPQKVRDLFLSADAPQVLVDDVALRVQGESYLAFLDMMLLDRPRPRPVPEPVLAIGAGDDAIFTPTEVRATATAWDGTADVVDDIAHDMMLDTGWESVADRVGRWITAHA